MKNFVIIDPLSCGLETYFKPDGTRTKKVCEALKVSSIEEGLIKAKSFTLHRPAFKELESVKEFIALITVIVSYYMGSNKEITEIHLIEAEDLDSACEKLEKHYKNKNSEYDVTHEVIIDSINEKIK